MILPLTFGLLTLRIQILQTDPGLSLVILVPSGFHSSHKMSQRCNVTLGTPRQHAYILLPVLSLWQRSLLQTCLSRCRKPEPHSADESTRVPNFWSLVLTGSSRPNSVSLVQMERGRQ